MDLDLNNHFHGNASGGTYKELDQEALHFLFILKHDFDVTGLLERDMRPDCKRVSVKRRSANVMMRIINAYIIIPLSFQHNLAQKLEQIESLNETDSNKDIYYT